MKKKIILDLGIVFQKESFFDSTIEILLILTLVIVLYYSTNLFLKIIKTLDS